MKRLKDIVTSLFIVVITIGLLRSCLYLEYQEAKVKELTKQISECPVLINSPGCLTEQMNKMLEQIQGLHDAEKQKPGSI